MLISDFDYHLPPELIAQTPLEQRDASRMLMLDRVSGHYADRRFSELPSLLRGNELMIVNNTRVIPARLFGIRGGLHAQQPGKNAPDRREFLRAKIEVLLLRCVEPNVWEALVRPGRKLPIGEHIAFAGSDLQAEIISRGEFGMRRLRLTSSSDVNAQIERIGHMPLPPYIHRGDEPADRERYQTMFASHPGAVAAPTAGLHFTPEILQQIRARGVEVREITLDVGLGTFQPLHTDNLDEHKMHGESYAIPPETADAISAARRDGRPVLAIGTTVVRTLEDAAQKAAAADMPEGSVAAGHENAEIFIQPGHRFLVVDQMLTNFHLPKSTLLVLVSAFAGRESILAAYADAVASHYRFYSYGDCMLIR